MENKVEREILKYISQYEGEIGFYHIARRFGQPDSAYDLPAVVENMVEEGFVEVMNIGVGTDERYRLTEKGRLTLSS